MFLILSEDAGLIKVTCITLRPALSYKIAINPVLFRGVRNGFWRPVQLCFGF